MVRVIRSLLPLVLALLFLPGTASAAEAASAAVTLEVDSFTCSNINGKIREETLARGKTFLCNIGDDVTVTVKNLAQWMEADTGHRPEKLLLVLDGYVLVGENGRLNGDALNFGLRRLLDNPNNIAAWKSLMARTKLFVPEVMTLTMMLEGGTKQYGKQPIGIKAASYVRLSVIVIFVMVLLGVFVWLIRHHDLLRDPGPQPLNGKKKPFSLGYTQMAFWSFLVILGFLYVWIASGDFSVLNPGMLGLIGISASTALISTAIADSKRSSAPEVLARKQRERIELLVQLDALADEIATTTETANTQLLRLEQDDKARRLAAIDTDIGELTAIPESQGFLIDILRSGNQIEFPRLQMVAWTVALGLVFAHSVFTTLSMPAFDATLLGLMGLSSGTYIGFKFPSTASK